MAYNSFPRTIPKGGKIVYGLMDGDYVFYVGITVFLRSRYQQHYSEGPACKYIYNMRREGRHPGIIIFGVFDIYGQAEAAEHSLIRMYAAQKHKLCNYHQNPQSNQLILPRPEVEKLNKKRPSKLLGNLVKKAMEDYQEFRNWTPTPIFERFADQ